MKKSEENVKDVILTEMKKFTTEIENMIQRIDKNRNEIEKLDNIDEEIEDILMGNFKIIRKDLGKYKEQIQKYIC